MYCIPSLFVDVESDGSSQSCFIKPYQNTQKVDKAQILLETHLISFTLEGEKHIITPESRVSSSPKSFILLKKGRCLMTEKLSPNGDFKSLLCFIDDAMLLDFFRKYELTIPQSSSKQDFSILERDTLLSAIIQSLDPYFSSNVNLSPAVTRLKTEEILLQIVQTHGVEALAFLVNDIKASRHLEFKKVVEANALNKLSADELAFLCNMSPSTFRRNFINVYGTTPGKWLLQKRLEKAADLLRHNEYGASEVYLQVGFESLSGFIQSFRKHFGLTPKKFQNS